jgi:membrane protein
MGKKSVLICLGKKYISDDIGRFSAALSYYMVFSFFPILIITNIFIASLKIDPVMVENFLKGIVPNEIAALAKDYITYVYNYGGLKILFISGFFTLYFPVRFVENLMAGINVAYGLKNTRSFFHRYAIIFLFVILVYIMFGMTFLSVILGKGIFVSVMRYFDVPLATIYMWQNIRIILLFAAMFISLTALYYISPCIKLRLKDVLAGSAFSSSIWMIVSMIFSYYAENLANYSALYGSIAAVMMLLYWLFLTAVILLMGAELNSILFNKKQA